MITGLFEPSHMQYSYDRDQEKEPSLSEMTVKALEILQKNDNGFFLMVEGEKIILVKKQYQTRSFIHCQYEISV